MRRDRREGGQVLALFALSLVAIIAMAALLFDAADALVTRRKLQNAGDAAAIAGSNLVQTGGSSLTCSTSGAGGAPRADIVNAVYASIDANMPGFNHADVHISCPTEWGNQGVRVVLGKKSMMMFAGPVLGHSFDVATNSTAINGQVTSTVYSVVLLDPSNAAWPNARRGCPSVLFSGGPTVLFDGSMQVDSACTATNGGALATNGNAATLTMATGRTISVVGGYSPAALTISPLPLTGRPSVDDPLGSLDPPTSTGMTLRSASKLTLNNTSQVLEPGIYRGGIELKNSSKAFLKPGIYYIDGGGVALGAQSQVFSIQSNGTTSTTTSSWAADCPDTTCGVLIYNAGTASTLGQFSVAAGAVLKLRAYDDRAVSAVHPDFRNLLLWQSATPAASISYAQPVVYLNGGGNVDISGTLYAPQALVHMGGSSGGSGGGNVDLTLQFIAWDMELQGNAAFHFYYSANDFARPKDYGLVE
jgi:hypothetical protein